MKSAVILDSEDRISEEALAQSATQLVPVGCLLLVVRSGILSHSIPVAIAGRQLALNQDLKAFVSFGAVAPQYLRYFIEGHQSQLLVLWRKEGATVESLELGLIAKTRIPVPPVAEQHAIAAFLDRETGRIDALIAKKEQLLALVEEKRTALVTSAVTKGLDPTVPMKGSGVEWLGEVPAHWELWRLKFLVREPLTYGASEAAELADPECPRFIRITDIREDGTLRDDTFRSLPEGTAQPYLLEEGDVLFARSGATVGKTFRYDESWGRAAFAGYLIRARMSERRVSSRFVQYFTQSKAYWDWLGSSFIQATIQNVSAERYAHLLVPVPPRGEQEAILSFLDSEGARIENLTARIRDAIALLREYRTALIAAAVTGQIDVSKEDRGSEDSEGLKSQLGRGAS